MTHYIFPGLSGIDQKAYRFSLPNKALFITSFVFQELGVSEDFIRTMDRKRTHAFARQLSMYLIRKNTTASLKKIGAFFGRHHTTVIFNIETVENDLATNKRLREQIQGIIDRFEKRKKETA